MTRSICMKLLEIIFSDMNFEIMYRIFVSDVTIIKFLWSEIPWIHRIMWVLNISRWRHFRSILVLWDAEKTTEVRFWLELTDKIRIFRFALTECTWRAVQSTLLFNFLTQKSCKIKESETWKISSRLIWVRWIRWAQSFFAIKNFVTFPHKSFFVPLYAAYTLTHKKTHLRVGPDTVSGTN